MKSLLDWLLERARPIGQAAGGAALLLALAAAGAWFVNRDLGGCPAHLDLQFAGETGCDVTEGVFRDSLWRDMLFAVVYGGALWTAARATRRQEHLDPRLAFLDASARWGPPAAAACDVLENLVLMHVVDATPGGLAVEGDGAAAAVTTLATIKWALLLLAVAALLLRLANRRGKEGDTAPSAWAPSPGAEDELALCFSGGGIRSAGFSLGVLHALDQSPVKDRIGMVAAVSGGNYAATGWLLCRASDDEADSAAPAAAVVRGLLGEKSPLQDQPPPLSVDPGHRTSEGRHRFLANGPGGLTRAVIWSLLAVLGNVAQLLVVLVAVGWPLGQLLASHGFHPGLKAALTATHHFDVAGEHARVAGLLLVIALVLVILPAFPRLDRKGPRRALNGAAKGIGALLALWVFVLIVLPWGMVQVSDLGGERTFQIGGVSLVAVVAALARTFRDPLRRMAPRLGGVALLALVLLALGKVVRDSVVGAGPFHSEWVWLGCAAAALLLAYGIDTQTWSLREMYRARLANSFVRKPDRPTNLWDRIRGGDRGVGRLWTGLPARPELIVCCAASRVGLSPQGAPAEPFTISQHQVSHHRTAGSVAMPTGEYIAVLTSWATRLLRSPAGWLATSGAAFASAMGRSSIGSTNALMAALNIDLGVWLPTLDTVSRRRSIPPVGLGHLANEVLGLYSERDRNIFVSDGGHVENLGLVELLRNRRRRIVCVDASGDELGSFKTLRAALRVADTTLPDEERLTFDLRELEASELPAEQSVYEIPMRRWASPHERVGTIYYLKLQPSLDQSRPLREFAAADPRFPNYSTANQLLDDQQFSFLLLAGAQAGERLVRRLQPERP